MARADLLTGTRSAILLLRAGRFGPRRGIRHDFYAENGSECVSRVFYGFLVLTNTLRAPLDFQYANQRAPPA